MLKIVIGGQINKQEICDFIKSYLNNNVEIAIKGDLEAVNEIKKGNFDYYVGACNTGGGGALAMAMALLGKDKCLIASMPSKILSDLEIEKAVNDGKIAFGFTAQHALQVLPVILDSLNKKIER